MKRSVVCLVLSLAAPLAAQQTFVVDTTGAGQFTEIQPAINAASAGDTILVRSGFYQTFDLDKGLNLLADPGVSTALGLNTVHDIPRGEVALIRGIQIGGAPFPGELDITNCAGRVHLERVRSGGTLMVSNCAQVSLRDCDFAGALLGPMRPGGEIIGSIVAVADTSFGGTSSQPALRCDSSDVSLAGVDCAGGASLGSGSPGLVVLSGNVRVTGTPVATIAAGSFLVPTAVPAVDLMGGTLTIDPSVVLLPQGGAPAVVGPGTLENQRIAAVSSVLQGRLLTIEVFAPGTTNTVTLATTVAAPPAALALGLFWPFLIDTAVADSGSVADDGRRSFNLPLPALLAPGSQLAVQSIVMRRGALELSTPLVLTTDG